MKAMSFAYTIKAMKARAKCSTRRDWKQGYALNFYEGMKFLAVTRQLRFGGEPFGIGQLTADPILERTGKMTEQDYEDEGFLWMEKNGLLFRGRDPRQAFEEWKAANEMLYVVRFNILEIF
jgi:hypothetical protein